MFLAFLKPGDTFLGMDLSQGGHLTHGSPVNFSGLLYKAVSYGVTDEGIIDYDAMRAAAREHRPKMIIAGYSAYSRVDRLAAFAEVAKEVGAIFMVDMAHFAGLVATGVYPSPVPHADVVTTTTHKTLRGPRGGIILCKAEHAKAIDKAVFPGMQGGPLEHVIAAKAVAFREALDPSFTDVLPRGRGERAGARRGADRRAASTSCRAAPTTTSCWSTCATGASPARSRRRRSIAPGITVNKNTVPKETQSPFVTSGIRIGTPAVTTRGMGADAMEQIAELIDRVLHGAGGRRRAGRGARRRCKRARRPFPLYPQRRRVVRRGRRRARVRPVPPRMSVCEPGHGPHCGLRRGLHH